jgi:hypothetical protein
MEDVPRVPRGTFEASPLENPLNKVKKKKEKQLKK